MNIYAVIGSFAGVSLAAVSGLTYWMPPDGLIISPLLPLLGTVAGGLLVVASWIKRKA